MLNNFKLRGRMLLAYSVPFALIAGLAIGFYRTHLRSIAVSVSPVRYGFGFFFHHRPMISRPVAIESCETTCLSA